MSKLGPSVRLFVDQPLRRELEVAVGGGQAHYLTRVMRLQSGDRFLLFNGRDGEWLARIISVSRSWCELLIESMSRPQGPEPGPTLVFAPIKKEPMRVLVEKGTELGVARLSPMLTRNTAAERVNLDRMRAHVGEAAEQCGRLTIPEIDAPKPLPAFVAEWPESSTLLFMDERGSGHPIADAIAALVVDASPPPPPGILVGPEGGFTADEAEAVRALGCAVPVSMGPRILRAETAVLAALACWQAFAGDWRAAHHSE